MRSYEANLPDGIYRLIWIGGFVAVMLMLITSIPRHLPPEDFSEVTQAIERNIEAREAREAREVDVACK